jgi:hypothetical protein
VKRFISIVATAVFIMVVMFAVSWTVVSIVDPQEVSALEACLDRNARWNYDLDACECEPKELASPTVSKERLEYCEAFLPPFKK